MIIWVCLGAFIALTLWTVTIKHVSVLDVQRAIAKRVEGRWRTRGHRKLDELHASASDDD